MGEDFADFGDNRLRIKTKTKKKKIVENPSIREFFLDDVHLRVSDK